MSIDLQYTGRLFVEYGREDGTPYTPEMRLDGIFEGRAWIFVIRTRTGEPIVKGKRLEVDFDVMDPVPLPALKTGEAIALVVGSRFFGQLVLTCDVGDEISQ